MVMSACFIEDDSWLGAVNDTGEPVQVQAIDLTGDSSFYRELQPGEEMHFRDGGDECDALSYEALDLDGNLVERIDQICKGDPWQIDGVPDR